MVRLAWLNMEKGQINLTKVNEELKRTRGTLLTDCEAMYDAIHRNESSGLGMEDRRSAIETLSVKMHIAQAGTNLRWLHSHAMLADGMTKDNNQACQLMRQFLMTLHWKLVIDKNFISARKRSAAGKGILEDADEGDRLTARQELERRRLLREQGTTELSVESTRPTFHPMSFLRMLMF